MISIVHNLCSTVQQFEGRTVGLFDGKCQNQNHTHTQQMK